MNHVLDVGSLAEQVTARHSPARIPSQAPENDIQPSCFGAELRSALHKCQVAQMDAVHACPQDPALPPGLSAEIEKTAADMEAMFIGQLLKAMWQTIPESEYSMKGTAGEIYRDIYIEQVSKMASQGAGIGLKVIVRDEMLARERARYTPTETIA
jgi:Rod binding domain-containing protein